MCKNGRIVYLTRRCISITVSQNYRWLPSHFSLIHVERTASERSIMITIHVYGIPDAYPKDRLKELCEGLEAAAEPHDPPSNSKKVVAFFPTDLYQGDIGRNLFISINSAGTGHCIPEIGSILTRVTRLHFKTAWIGWSLRSCRMDNFLSCAGHNMIETWGFLDKVEVETDPKLEKCPTCGSGTRKENGGLSGPFRLCPNCGDERCCCIN